MPRKVGEVCGDCVHFDLHGDSDRKGYCCRYPPSTKGERPPITLGTQACGELEKRGKDR